MKIRENIKKEWAKTEGQLHKLHKDTVAKELQKQNYTIYCEPLESPLKLLWWHSYRPDILAIRQSDSIQKVVLVECETNPNRKRVLTKKKQIKKNFHFKINLLNTQQFFLYLLFLQIIFRKYFFQRLENSGKFG